MYPRRLLSPITLGNLELKNRVLMAPLTRLRASQPDDAPTELNACYYAQRAGAGLIVSEGTQISKQGQGHVETPGIYTDEQQAGWAKVVSAVHAGGGKMALQLWHVGRVSHHLVQGGNRLPVAPSAIRAEETKVFVRNGGGELERVQADTPRALETAELLDIVQQYADAATRAKLAGFDMVEIHAANGYLLHQFMSTNTNHRSDAYGGDVENRLRLVVEVIQAVVGVYGEDRIGIRISPHFSKFDMKDTDAEVWSLHLARHLTRIGLAYLHVAEPDWAGGESLTDAFRDALRAAYSGKIIASGQYTAESAEARISSGQADAVAFGRLFLANPDLVERFRLGAPLNEPNSATFYGGGQVGYTDYAYLGSPSADLRSAEFAGNVAR